MIPVAPQPAPAEFEREVKNPGLDWLNEKRIPHDGPAAANLKWNALWTKTIDYAHQAYGGLCAYLACHLELATGEVTIDHHVSKKSTPRLAYEWCNYRLASLGVNRAKGELACIDPFEVQMGWFQLELVSGRIFANPTLPDPTLQLIELSIRNLKLDNARCRKMRAQYFKNYRDGLISSGYLQLKNPLVFAEALRQELL